MNDIFSVRDSVIAFIGGYGYLAKPVVQTMSQLGAKVVVMGRSKEKFDQVYNNVDVVFVECDANNSTTITRAFLQIEKLHGRIDVLINGSYGVKSVHPELIPDEDWEYSINASLNAYHNAIREIIPFFKKNGGGKVINFSSMYGLRVPDFSVYDDFPNFINPPHYGVAKAGVIHLTKYYASYLGKENIIVNAVSPGPFPSESVQSNTGFVEKLAEKTVLNRIGQPNELVGIFLLLCSEMSSYITGQNFIVDGGWTIKG